MMLRLISRLRNCFSRLQRSCPQVFSTIRLSLVLLAALLVLRYIHYVIVQAPRDDALVEAVKICDPDLVRAALKSGASPNARDRTVYNNCFGSYRPHTPALVMAVSRRDIEIVDILLEAGADPNLYSSEPALYRAASFGDVLIAQALLNYGARTDLRNQSEDTALIEASQRGQFEMVKLLLANGAARQINAHGFIKFTALSRAAGCYSGQWARFNAQCGAVAQILLDSGADPNLRDSKKYSAFDRANDARYGRAEVVAVLNGKRMRGVAHKPVPIVEAIRYGGLTRLQKRITSQINLNEIDKTEPRFYGESKTRLTSPLIAIAHYYRNDMNVFWQGVRVRAGMRESFITRGGERSSKDILALHFDNILARRASMAKVLLSARSKLRLCGGRDRYAVFEAALAGQSGRLKSLLDSGANPNVSDIAGFTPLMAAASAYDKKCVRLLVLSGAKTKAADRNGWRAYDWLPMHSSFPEEIDDWLR